LQDPQGLSERRGLRRPGLPGTSLIPARSLIWRRADARATRQATARRMPPALRRRRLAPLAMQPIRQTTRKRAPCDVRLAVRGWMEVVRAASWPSALPWSLASATAECPGGAWDGDERQVPATASALPQLAAHLLSRSVRAMAVFGPHLVLGGSFLGHTSNDLDYLVSWDGAKAQPIGGGLDGAVYALLPFRSRLVVGGAFSQLYQVRVACLLCLCPVCRLLYLLLFM